MACGLAGLLIGYFQTPIYQARTSIEVVGSNENFLNLRDLDPTASSASYSPESYVETQVRILRDEALIERAVAQLKLDQNPSFTSPRGPFTSMRARLGLDRRPAAVGLEPAVAVAMKNLKVHPAGLSRVVEVLYDSPDAEIAANFANTLVHQLIDLNSEVRYKASQTTSGWLTGQLGELKATYEKAARALQAYTRSTGLMFTQEDGNTIAEARFRQLQEEFSKAQADRVAKQAHYDVAQSSPPSRCPRCLTAPL